MTKRNTTKNTVRATNAARKAVTKGDRRHLERALDRVNDLLGRFKTREQWARDLVARLGRPVTKDDYREYIDALTELADQRALITQMMGNGNAQEE